MEPQTKIITVNFEVSIDTDKDTFIEAITNIVHDTGDSSHTFYLMDHVIDVIDPEDPVE
jgi:hypothetical protein